MKQSKNWDAAEYLDDDKLIKAYLNAALREDDQEFFLIALGNIARAKGMSQLSEKTGITRDGLYKALSPTGNPSFSTLSKVLNALDLEWKLVELGGQKSKQEHPNAETLKAMQEVEEIFSGKIKAKTCTTSEELFKAFGI